MRYALLLLMVTSLVCAQDTTKKSENTGSKESGATASYALGHQIGTQLKNNGIDVNLDEYFKGIREGLADNSPFEKAELDKLVREWQGEFRAKAAERKRKEGEMNQKEGEAFLTANKAKEGVVETSSGLQYKVLTAGTGKTPKKSDRVKVHYTGKLIDGTVFDSSVQRGQPASFGCSQVIKGWTEALTQMKEGDKWELYIPGKLAY